MPLYKVIVSYDGSSFAGFQRQTSNEDTTILLRPMSNKKRKHADGSRRTLTVQHCLEEALIRYVTDEPTKTAIPTLQEMCLKCAGRTDRGVHARGQVLAVNLPLKPCITKTEKNSKNDNSEYWIRMEEIRRGINSRLPREIAVASVEELPTTAVFEPRHEVQRKLYSYTLKYRRFAPPTDLKDDGNFDAAIARLGPNSIRDPFDPPCMWLVPWALDDRLLPELCRQLEGHHNYRAFIHKNARDEKDQSLTVDRISVSFESVTGQVPGRPGCHETTAVVIARVEFEAKSFRRCMIRNLVGYCVDVCRKYEPVTGLSWEQIWNGDDGVASLINSAPASGLCLEYVSY